MDSAAIHEEVKRANSEFDYTISEECARAIARNWMAPNTALSAFAHNFNTVIVDLNAEVNREIQQDKTRTVHDLYALSAFIDSQIIPGKNGG